jgi:hypothetical protein
MSSDGANGLVPAAGDNRIVAGGRHYIIAVPESDRVASAARVDCIVARAHREDDIVAVAGIDRPVAGVIARDDNAVIAAPGRHCAGTARREEIQVVLAG